MRFSYNISLMFLRKGLEGPSGEQEMGKKTNIKMMMTPLQELMNDLISYEKHLVPCKF